MDKHTTPVVDENDVPIDSPEAPAAQGSDPPAHHVPIGFSAGTGGRVIIFAIIAAVILAVIFFVGSESRRRAEASLAQGTQAATEQPDTVDVATVVRTSSERYLTLPGESRAFYETTIFARTSGYLSRWYVDIGDHVKAGQTLATIETPELDDKVAESRAQLAALRAQVKVAQTSVDFARVSFDRWQSGIAEGVVSKQERDEKKSQLDADMARLQAAQAQVQLGEAELQGLNTLIGFKKVVAPFDGTITQRHVDMGDLVTAGSTTNTSPLFTLSQTNRIRVFVDVPQIAAPEVKVGTAVIVKAREFIGRQFVGTVDRTAGAVDQASRTLKVEAVIPNADFALMPGMYVEVNFTMNRAKPSLSIPAAAIHFSPQGPQVAVVGADGRVTFHLIKIDQDLGDIVETDSGLTAGQTVALNIGNQVAEGDKIVPHNLDQPEKPATAAPAEEPAAKGSTAELHVTQ